MAKQNKDIDRKKGLYENKILLSTWRLKFHGLVPEVPIYSKGFYFFCFVLRPFDSWFDPFDFAQGRPKQMKCVEGRRF